MIPKGLKNLQFHIMFVGLTAIFLIACSKSNNAYSIKTQGNNLYISMPHPTMGVVGFNEADWRGVELSTVVEDVLQKLWDCDLNGDCSLYVRFETSKTDKYGNETSSYDEHFVVRIPISEARKYKDAKHLDSNYSISERISELAFPTGQYTSIFEQLEIETKKGESNLAYIPGDSIKIGDTYYFSDAAHTDTVPATMVFFPQNAIIIDERGGHNFEHFDCPSMNVTDDNGKRVTISWGGEKLVLNKSANNDDTYSATGHTSRGNLTLKAFRSASSGQIYLVTATMPNPIADVKQITINFKH